MGRMKTIFFFFFLLIGILSLKNLFSEDENTKDIFEFTLTTRIGDEKFEGSASINLQRNEISFIAENKDMQFNFDNGHFLVNGIKTNEAPPMIQDLERFLETVEEISESIKQKKFLVFDHFIHSLFKAFKVKSSKKERIFKLKYTGVYYVIKGEINDSNEFELKQMISEEFIIDFKSHHQVEDVPNLQIHPKSRKWEHEKYPHRIEDIPWYEKRRTCRINWLKHKKSCAKKKIYSFDAIGEKETIKKDCFFVHGVGTHPEEVGDGSTLTKWKHYWGNVDKYVGENCKNSFFIREETLLRGYTDKSLQESICHKLSDGSSVIENKIIFTHSMGNLILAQILKNEICTMDKESTSWYQIACPAFGSNLANSIEKICETTKDNGNVIDRSVKFVAEKLQYCNEFNKPNPAYTTMKPKFTMIDKSAMILNEYATGRMCGNSTIGLVTQYSIGLTFFESLGLPKPSDGMVSLKSCKASIIQDFKDQPSSLFYQGSLNHADLTCRNGNGWYGRDRKPCNYFSDKF